MVEKLKPDICIIGVSPGSALVALAAAGLGATVVLVERPQSDGEAHATGAARPLALLGAARRAEAMRGAGAFGVKAALIEVDFAKVREHVRRTAAAVASNYLTARLTGLGVRVIDGAAHFKDYRTLVVGDAFEIAARRFVIATGSEPALPPIAGLDQGPYLTDDTIFDLAERPAHLLVVGAGSSGLELAQAFRRLGSEVTVFDAGEPLAGEDAECVGIVLDGLMRDGVAIRAGAKIARIEHGSGKVRVILEAGEGEERVEGSHLLLAAGRKPALDGLDLAAAGIAYDASGIAVNGRLKTKNKRVYAIGTGTGKPHAAQATEHYAGLVIRDALLRQRVRVNDDLVPAAVFTDPELARVGLSEAEARRRGLKITISRWPYHDNVRAQAELQTHGHIKFVTTPKGKILGATIVGVAAAELIAPWTLAIAQGLNISVFAELAPAHPTLSEIGKSAAMDFFAQRLTRSWARRIIPWLRIFG